MSIQTRSTTRTAHQVPTTAHRRAGPALPRASVLIRPWQNQPSARPLARPAHGHPTHQLTHPARAATANGNRANFDIG